MHVNIAVLLQITASALRYGFLASMLHPSEYLEVNLCNGSTAWSCACHVMHMYAYNYVYMYVL